MTKGTLRSVIVFSCSDTGRIPAEETASTIIEAQSTA
ncbi:hypothetical protein CP061683_1495, partial [Chlamydia psittaci 06-1683]